MEKKMEHEMEPGIVDNGKESGSYYIIESGVRSSGFGYIVPHQWIQYGVYGDLIMSLGKSIFSWGQ